MPIDVVKVRMQMQGADGTRQFNGLLDAGLKTAQKEGIGALWKGLPPALVRQVKQQLIKHELIVPGTVSGVLISSLASGLLCALTTSPLDVVKSRVMGQPVGANGHGLLYSGMVDCFVKSVRNEGILSLYKGFLPNWGRLGPRGVICFVTMEMLNKWFP
ncbi:uncharacterized protein MONBRDRAFT_9512 [Monosiga brevicollis MX1]|uniref:Uncharacterized protein n=1 Tax=Monosiga brevicollis TaxID=81824 RepID=A9V3D9_MONBE|nr:uncharacterized protein MONBRDRAFT_9512 [Monosiga brevicollis MX1]EDQ88172.1 predicted protein [Monosiga brevicollis MX1]|eukprot:XP_001747248.1 hypothetical protein [Monosiga brevicollis MX1]